jgi:hypothetical protein
MKRQDLEKMIHEIVREEVRNYLPVVLPIVVSEVVQLHMKKLAESMTPAPAASKKSRQPLRESVDEEEWPLLGGKSFDKTSLTELLGYGSGLRMGDAEAPPVSHPTAMAVPPVFNKVTEHGTAVPVAADELPDHVVSALTRDYSQLMKAMDAKKKGV